MKIRRDSTRRWLEAAALGVMSGLRALMPAATVATRLASDGTSAATGNPARRLLATPMVARGLRWGASLELVGDKLPFTPPRIMALPLVGRAAWGAMVAVAWTDARRARDVAAAAVLGAAAATGGAFAGYELRRRATVGRRGLGNFVTGAVEDLVAMAAVYLTAQPRLRDLNFGRRRTITRSKGYVFH
ncbi:MAG TPA: DUF4126 family protein [Polyangia bacterium]